MKRLRLIAMVVSGLGISLGATWFFSRPATDQKQSTPLTKQKSVQQASKQSQSPKQNSKQTSAAPKLQKKAQVEKKEERIAAVSEYSSIEDHLKGVPQTAGEAMEQLLFEVGHANDREIEAKILAKIQQLQDFGEEGSKAIFEFLKTNEDIELNRYIRFNGKNIRATSLRIVLIETLYEMNDPTAQAANLEVLKITPLSCEAILATRNLENFWPGVYRAEALNTVLEILASGKGAGRELSEIVGYYQAQEIIPQIENMVKEQPRLVYDWMQCLSQFPPEDQSSSLARFFNQEEIRKKVITEAGPFFLGGFDYSNDRSRRLAYGIFTKDLNSAQKLGLITALSRGVEDSGAHFLVMKPEQPQQSPDRSNKIKAKTEGLLKFLDEIEPVLDTPNLKTNLENVRKKVQEALGNMK